MRSRESSYLSSLPAPSRHALLLTWARRRGLTRAVYTMRSGFGDQESHLIANSRHTHPHSAPRPCKTTIAIGA